MIVSRLHAAAPPPRPSPENGDARPRRLVGIHDEVFTLFQFAGLVDAARESGRLQGRLLDLVTSPGSAHDWPAATVSYAQLRQLLEAHWQGVDRERVLFDHARRIDARSFGRVGNAAAGIAQGDQRIAYCAERLRTAWRAAPRRDADGGVTLLHVPRFLDPEMAPTLELFHFVNCVAFIRATVSAAFAPQMVAFSRDAGVSASALRDFFRCPVHIGAWGGSVTFSPEWIRRQAAAPGAGTNGAGGTGAQAERPPDLRTVLQELWECEDDLPSADVLGERLGMSRRTLERRLGAEGVSVARLVREVKLVRARRLIAAGRPFDRVAESLGFSDERSFRRAFRGWTGLSPSEFRAGAANAP